MVVIAHATRYDDAMIGKLTGIIADIRTGRVVVDVQGVGYLVAVRSPLDFVLGKAVSLHTHLAVRENALDLYGFVQVAELTMFEELIKLPKIGPKSALQILMQADVALIEKAVIDQDPVYLSKMSGMSKKTAEKIVTELKEIFEARELGPRDTAHTGDADTIDALITLGYSQKDAREALHKLPATITGTNERIKHALRTLGKN